MPTSLNQDKKFKFIYWAQIFLALGFLASPTVVSLYHIVIIIPAFLVIGPLLKEIKISKSSWVLLAIFTWATICTLVNYPNLVKPHKSFQELKYYLLGWLLIYPLYYFYKRASKEQIQKLLKIVSVIIIAAFFVGISKAWFKFDPVKFNYDPNFHIRSGGFSHYMRYGYASGFLFLIGISMYINRKKIKPLMESKLIVSAVIFCFLAILTSQTRGALLGLIVASPFLLYRYKPLWAKIIAGLGAVFFIAVIIASVSGKVKYRYLNINQASNNVRMSQFQTAIKAIKDNPVFGLGADQFSYNVKRIKTQYNIHAKRFESHAHNIFLEHGASYGILGIILLALFFGIWFWEMSSLKDAFGWTICSYIIAYTASGQVENLFDNANSHLLFYIYTLSQVYRLNGIRCFASSGEVSQEERAI